MCFLDVMITQREGEGNAESADWKILISFSIFYLKFLHQNTKTGWIAFLKNSDKGILSSFLMLQAQE